MAFDPFAEEVSAGPFDPFANDAAPSIGALTKAKKQNKTLIGDIGTGLKRGVEQIPGMATGIADIVAAPVSALTGVRKPVSKMADWLGEKTGFQPEKWAEAAQAEYSPEMQEAQANVEQAKGFLPTLKAVAENPRYAGNLIAESLPSTVVGGLAARGAMGAVVGAERLAAMRAAAAGTDAVAAKAAREGLMKAGSIAGGIGEGVVTTGQQMAQTDESVDPLRAAGAALGAGVGTGVLGAIGGRVANKMGLPDPDTVIATGTLGEGVQGGIKAIGKRMALGGIQEGVFEELPQSAQEQVWQNVANGKPWDEGIGQAAAQGLIAGTAMGAGVNAIPRRAPTETPPLAEDVPPPTDVPPTLGLPQLPDAPLVVFPDGSTGTQAQFDEYIKSLPPEQRASAMGQMLYGQPPGTPTVEQSDPNTATVPNQDGTETVIDRRDGPLSAAAVSSVKNGVLRERDFVPPPSGSFGQMNELASLIDSERQDVEGRRNALVQSQQLRRASDMESTDARVEAARIQQTNKQRDALLQNVLENLPEGQNPNRAFGRALQAMGFTDTQFRPEEIRTIANWNNVIQGAQEPDAIPSSPNELDAAAFGIRSMDDKQKIIEANRLKFEETRRRIQAQRNGGQNGTNAIAPTVPEVATSSLGSSSGQLSGSGSILASAPIGDTGSILSRAKVAESGVRPAVPAGIASATGVTQSIQPQGLTNVASPTPDQAVESQAQRTEAQPAATVTGYQLGRAKMLAGRATNQGRPTEIYPHPTQPGMYALRPIGENNASRSEPTNVQQPAEAQQATEQVAPIAAVQGAQEVAQLPARRPVKPKTAPIMRRDDLVGAIMRATGGRGIHSNMAQTLVGDTANNATRVRGLFTNQGQQDMDDLAMLLREQEGYDIKDGTHLEDLVREAASGNVAKSMARMEQEKNDQAEKEHRGVIRQKAKDLGIKTVARKITDIEKDIAAHEMEAKRQADDEAILEREAIQSLSNETMSDDSINELLQMTANNDGRQINEEWITNEQILDAFEPIAEGSEEQSSDGAGETVATETRGTGQERSQEARPDLALEGQTPAEVRAQEAQRQADEARANRSDPDTSPRVKADQVDLFNTQGGLFNSNRDAPVAQVKEKTIAELQEEIRKSDPFSRIGSDLNGQLIKRVSEDAQQAIDSGIAPTYETGQGTFVVVHPSAQNEGMIQVTRYSDRGVFGDSQYNTIESAIRDNVLWMKTRMSQAEAEKALGQSLEAEAEYQRKRQEAEQTRVDTASAPVASTEQPQQTPLQRLIAANKQKKSAENAARAAKLAELMAKRKAEKAAAQEEDATNDRDTFTVERVEDNERADVKFKRGEEVKIAGTYPMRTGKIEGISQAQRQFKVDGVWHDFGYAYKTDYDEFASARQDMDKLLSDARQRIADGLGFSRTDGYPIREARALATRYALEGYDATLNELEIEGQRIFDERTKALREEQIAREKAQSDKWQAERDAEAEKYSAPVQMTMDEWKGIHKDYKSYNGGDRTAMIGGRMRAVEIVKPGVEPVVAETAAVEKTETDMTPDWDSFAEFWNGLIDGEGTIDDVKKSFALLVDEADAFRATIAKMKNDQLKRMLGWSARPDDKKADLVRKVYDQTLVRFTLNKSAPSQQWTYGEKMDVVEKRYQDQLRAVIDSLTDADLTEFRDSIAENSKARKEALEQKKAAAADPKTLEDFEVYATYSKNTGKTADEARQALTPEQRATWDSLLAEKSRTARQNSSAQQKADVKVAAVTTKGQIIETKHTKTGEDLFVVKAAERVERDVYNHWNEMAKRLGGWYSSFRGNGAVPGFQFKTRENAQAFLKFLGGDVSEAKESVQERRDAFEDDKSQSAVDRLNDMADRLDERADESLGRDRKANTDRRARFAAAAEASAQSDKALAKTMRNIAKAIQDGTAKLLDRVRQKTQVEMLQEFVRNAKDAELRSKYPAYIDQERHKGEPADIDTAEFAQWPTYSAERSDLANLARQLLETDGTKKLGQQLLKIADDITAEYKKFAKENLHKVSVFKASREGSAEKTEAVFSTQDAAERAIARSGYNGKATTISFKRGEHLVIMGPTMARERGVWAGDDNKRITLAPDSGELLVEKLGKMARTNRDAPRIPWQFENAYDKRKRLSAIGIETPAEFRSALREFIGLREQAKAPDRVKELERSMIGRKNDGLDFFPTPKTVAQQMIDAAELKEGMSVLEPSAGWGHIAEMIRDSGVDPDVIELSNDRKELLDAKGFNVVGRDFMETDGQYDRIIMNPPFSDRRDAQHVQHAYSILRPGGRLVAIMGEGVFFGQDKKAEAFRNWLEEVGGTSEQLEAGSFLDPSLPVNTGVNARMVVIDKSDAMYSQGQSTGTPITQQTAEQRIKSRLGDKLGRVLVESGIVTFTHKGREYQGATFGNGSIALNLDNLTEESFDGVFLHEGFHSTVRELIGEETYQRLIGQLDTLLKNKAPWATEAKAAVPADTKASDVTEEVGAYAIEAYVNGDKQAFPLKRWAESFLSALRTSIIRHLPFGKLKAWAVNNLQAQDLARLAVAGLKAKARGQLQAQGTGAVAYSKSSLFHDARSFVRSVMNGEQKFKFFDFATVGEKEAESLKEKTGLDLSGYTHSIDDDAVRHAMRKHGNMNSEIRRGQIGVNADDLAMIPDIVSNYDSVQRVEDQGDGRMVLQYSKTYGNGETVYLEEVRTGRKKLVAKTMWKVGPAVPRMTPKVGDVAHTSETSGGQPKLNVSEDVKYSKARVIGDSGRSYDPKQRAFFQNVGREIDQKNRVEKALDYLKTDFWKKMAIGLADQFRGLRDLNDGGQAYMLARLSKGTAGAFDTLLHHGKLSLNDGVYDGDTSGGFVDRLGVPLHGELDDFLWWVAANRAEKLTADGKENLFSANDIQAGKSLAAGLTNYDYTIQTGPGKGTVTRNRQVIYQDALRVFNEFQKNVLDMAEQSGLIDGNSRQYWESEFYVPFYRVSEEDGEFIGAKMGNALVRQQAFKKLKGGTDKLNSDLLTNTLMNMSHLIEASAKNRAAKAALQAAEKVGAAHKAVPGEKQTVWYQENGRKVEYKVDDPYVMTAITSLEYAGMRNGVMDAMTKFKHWLTIGVTASPAFKVRNLIRDSIQAIGTSDLSYNPIKNVTEGFKQTKRDSQAYVSALASGGLIRFGTMLEGSESSRVRQLIKSGVKDSSILNSEPKWRQFYDKYLEPGISAYNELGNRSEEINRAALYNQLIKQGKSHAEAALLARDLMDFSMQGSFNTIRFLSQVTPFFNARLQGMYKLGRSAKDNPRKLAVVTGAVALASIALMAGYEDDEDWKRREDWDRDGFFWFKFGGIEYRIPKPFEVGAVASLAERSVEYLMNDEMTGERFRKVVGALAMNNLSMNPVPQMVKPIIDLYANKDSFTGRPIESMGMQRLESTMRYNSSTSMPARGLSTVTLGALSPVQYDHLVRSYFGWLGSFVVGGGDMLARAMSDEPTKPSLDLFKFSTQGLAKEAGTGSSRYLSMVYDQAEELEKVYATHRQLIKDRKSEEAKAYAEDNQEALGRYRRVENVKKQETLLNARIRFIERSGATADEKKTQIDALNKRKEQIAMRIAPGLN